MKCAYLHKNLGHLLRVLRRWKPAKKPPLRVYEENGRTVRDQVTLIGLARFLVLNGIHDSDLTGEGIQLGDAAGYPEKLVIEV